MKFLLQVVISCSAMIKRWAAGEREVHSARIGNVNVIYQEYSPRERLFTARAPISKESSSIRQAS